MRKCVQAWALRDGDEVCTSVPSIDQSLTAALGAGSDSKSAVFPQDIQFLAGRSPWCLSHMAIDGGVSLFATRIFSVQCAISIGTSVAQGWGNFQQEEDYED
jgi:hypothetical protein